MPQRKECLGITGKKKLLPCYDSYSTSDKSSKSYDSKCMKKVITLNGGDYVNVHDKLNTDDVRCKEKSDVLICPRCNRKVIGYVSFYRNNTTKIGYIPITE